MGKTHIVNSNVNIIERLLRLIQIQTDTHTYIRYPFVNILQNAMEEEEEFFSWKKVASRHWRLIKLRTVISLSGYQYIRTHIEQQKWRDPCKI